MSRADLKRFEQLRIHTLVDFRSTFEQEQDPNRLPPGHEIKLLPLPILDAGNAVMAQEIRRMIWENDFGDFDADAEMVKTYRQFSVEFTDQYKQFVRAVLLAGGAPVLWHCTAGKDRAGFAAAIILRLLGVDQSVVIEDYMLSTRYVDSRKRLRFSLRLTKRAQGASVLKTLLQVQEHWIRAAFQSIDEHWDGFEGYTQRALQLSQADVRQLRKLLLD
jgi:protein-tyrosine phosphatase